MTAWPHQPWRRRAACRGADPDLFAPGGSDPAAAGAAKEVCSRCPVAPDCLAAAVRGNETGIWGGTDDGERGALARAAGNRGLAAERALHAVRQET